MEIKTQHNIGDEFWVMYNDKAQKCFVARIYIRVYEKPKDKDGNHREVVEVCYEADSSAGGVHQVTDANFYATKQFLLATL